MEIDFNSKEQDITWEEIILLHNSALKEIGTKLEILNDEFQHIHQYNPIEHIKSRIKSPESIVRKLKKKGYEVTLENMVKYVNDIAESALSARSHPIYTRSPICCVSRTT